MSRSVGSRKSANTPRRSMRETDRMRALIGGALPNMVPINVVAVARGVFDDASKPCHEQHGDTLSRRSLGLVAVVLGLIVGPATAYPSPGDPTVTQIATGESHSCAVIATGAVKCWGGNSWGQLGNGTLFVSTKTPTDVPTLTTGVVSISASADGTFTCALTTAGGVKCWGGNSFGNLGDGTTTTRTAPVAVLGLESGVASVSAGEEHACVVTTAGGVRCWGSNRFGKLGDGTNQNRSVPVDVSGLHSGVISVSAGSNHTCASMAAGGVKCWGQNGGRLGDGTSEDRPVPVSVTGLSSRFTAVAAGGGHTCGLSQNGAMKCWGYNGSGALGNGATTGSYVPSDVVGLSSGVTWIATGNSHTCASVAGGAKCWGSNPFGGIGDGTTLGRSVPVSVSSHTTDVMSVAAGSDFTCAVMIGGAAKCWGKNYAGSLGDGTTTNRLTPTAVQGLSQVGPSIAFTPPSGLQVGAATALTATSSSGLTVTFDTWTPDACSVSGNTVTPTSGALCGIRASQAADGSIAAAPQRLALIAVDGSSRPAVTSITASLVGSTNASLNANVVSDGGLGIVERGIVYAPTLANSSPRLGGTGVLRMTVTGGVGSFATDVTGLTPKTPYSFSAYATNAIGTGYTAVSTFTTTSLPTQIIVNGGNNQTAVAGRTVSTPPSVIVRDANSLPVSGVTVSFSVASGGGSVTGDTQITNASGIATVGSWRLGPGTNKLTATSPGLTGSPLTINANLGVVPMAVSAGLYHTCALTQAGGVKCWGNNFDGELGDGTTVDRTVAVDVFGLTWGVSSIASGSHHTCALTILGGVKCWGYNGFGALGDGTTRSRSIPVDVVGLSSGVVAISAGFHYTCAVVTGSSRGLKCWGNNGNGQLGDGMTTSRPIPADVLGVTGGLWGVSTGDFHACAMAANGSGHCWGSNNNGKLGNPTVTQHPWPLDVRNTGTLGQIVAGGQHSCARSATSAWCWGRNSEGQVGDGTQTTRFTGTLVPGLPILTSISAGAYHTCASTSSGVKCWGFNGNGQLGDHSIDTRLSPVDVVGLTSGVTSVSAGGYHTCAVTTAGGVKCWGYNGYGALGNGTFLDQGVPVDVAGLSRASISDAAVAEGSSGKSILAFTVTLSQPSVADVSMAYTTSDGTAVAGGDYTGTTGRFTIPAGNTSRNIAILVDGDTAVEANETITVTLTDILGGTISRSTATGMILNDDVAGVATATTQYRLYSPVTLEHLYTTDLNEYNVLGGQTGIWVQEGIGYQMLTNGMFGGVPTVPLFRLYHTGIRQHFWTTDSNEAVILSRDAGWFYEGTIGYVLPSQVAGTIPLYRMSLANPPLHLWTTDLNEYNVLATRGWVKEGVIGYVIP
jgi:alpha-tubulin suppressor-like RCC1 family protein